MLGFRVLKTLQEIQIQKNSKESTVQGAAVGRKRKSKKCLHFGKLEKDITSYKVFSFSFFFFLIASKYQNPEGSPQILQRESSKGEVQGRDAHSEKSNLLE